MTPLPVQFPLGGAIPAFFNGTALITITTGGGQSNNCNNNCNSYGGNGCSNYGNNNCNSYGGNGCSNYGNNNCNGKCNNYNVNGCNNSVTTMSLRIGIESPYLNPFGGPIIIATGHNEVVIVATYSQARIQWTNVQMAGSVTGTMGGTPVSGTLGMLVNSSEDLKFGMETDQGLITFEMNNTAYNAAGTFGGFSTIPRVPTIPCGSLGGLVFCTETGLGSVGYFSQATAGGMTLSGSYATTWTVPAFAFTSSVTGMLR
jgi:hypothetical protein